MATLFILMGAPGSGKSTWAGNNAASLGVDVISRDMIRFSLVKEDEPYFSKEKDVYKEFIKRINDLLLEDKDVFADATHLTSASRNKLINSITAPSVKLCGIWLKSSLEECLEHNENRKGTRGYVPPEQIEKMYKSFEKPTFEEGFYSIYIKENGKTPTIIYREDR